jgi:hypothetical protein
MNRLLIIGCIVVIIIGGVTLYFLFGSRGQVQNTHQTQTSTTLPIAGQSPNSSGGVVASSGQGLSLSTADGKTIIVANFLNNPATKADSINSGYYTLGPSANSGQPYSITYIASTQYFSIELLQEPIGQARLLAEQYLEQQLGLPTSDLCRLNYTVSTPSDVSSQYGGASLGFSFCPGSVVLPQ